MIKDRRAYFRNGLAEPYNGLYDRLCAVLPEHWQPICGRRLFEEQDALYAQGRTTPGPIVTAASGGLSFHNYGLASDWDYFPNGVYTPLTSTDPLWQEYIDACRSVGVRCISWEKPHNEYPSQVGIRAIFGAYSTAGALGVLRLLNQEISDAKAKN